MKRRTFLATALGAIGSSIACAWSAGGRLHTGAALAVGTIINIAVVHADEKLARRAIHAALDAAQQVDRLMSIYHADSQVFRLNRDGVLHQPDPQLLAVLEQARGLSLLTDGAFDISVQPLWHAYSVAAARGTLPDAQQQDRALALVDWRGVKSSKSRIELARPGMAVTLNGLAQGYAADVALAAVRAHGIEHALLDTGEFAARGRKHGQPWRGGPKKKGRPVNRTAPILERRTTRRLSERRSWRSRSRLQRFPWRSQRSRSRSQRLPLPSCRWSCLRWQPSR